MPIWAVADVSEHPELSLVRWRIYETETHERHFVGYNVTGREGRVSSAIQAFDPTTLRGVTRYGRTYELAGNPGFDADADYAWNHWQRINRTESFRDVTDEVFASTLLSLDDIDKLVYSGTLPPVPRSEVSPSKPKPRRWPKNRSGIIVFTRK